MFSRFGAIGFVLWSKSAEPDFEVEALFPCFAINSSDEAITDEVVLMLKV
jgi:hypothetical protein